ncbi:hypothetical protein B0F90DRAFT_1143543 [Multifurca ochricompacta]|uniref:Uncharacterized protein n=1 Tax=Multifurca ochricompacta TaxID=376703 RepID=A0AAD4LYM9_9AGAM|nr:hypothetical protein B0F90DRAFT_1143543 [Multifurca ochricompacta]
MPIFWPDSPYYSPLSSLAYFVFPTISLIFLLILKLIGSFTRLSGSAMRRIDWLLGCCCDWFSDGLGKTAEKTALNLSSEIDGRALMWTLESSDEDHELEQFFAGIPGFFQSTVVKNPQQAFDAPDSEEMSKALIGLMQRTWTSNLVHESVKQRRIVISEVATGQASVGLPISKDTVDLALLYNQDGFFSSVEFGLLLNGATYDVRNAAYCSKWAISKIIAGSKIVMIVGSNSLLSNWVSRNRWLKTTLRMEIVYTLPICSTLLDICFVSVQQIVTYLGRRKSLFNQFPNLIYEMHFLDWNMTSVNCGI